MSEEEKKAIEILKIEIDGYNRAMKIIEDVDLLDDYAEELEICETLLNLIEKQQKELETYKKIGEKLAGEVENLDDRLSAEIGNYIKGYCNIEKGCIFNYKRKCSECIIDWARKEVENENNRNEI